jgi:hypothetical protein
MCSLLYANGGKREEKKQRKERKRKNERKLYTAEIQRLFGCENV